MSAQTKFLAMLPTLAQSKARLREARTVFETRARVAEEMRDHLKRSKAEVVAAEAARDEAEGDLLAALAGTPEEVAADGAHAKAMRAVDKAEAAAAKVKDAVQKADMESADAGRELAAARSELRAVREGRRAK